jgi:hypothetical protein
MTIERSDCLPHPGRQHINLDVEPLGAGPSSLPRKEQHAPTQDEVGFCFMAIEARALYTSSNGDRWLLVRESETKEVLIKHEPNAASGGKSSHTAIGEFLRSGAHAPSTPR